MSAARPKSTSEYTAVSRNRIDPIQLGNRSAMRSARSDDRMAGRDTGAVPRPEGPAGFGTPGGSASVAEPCPGAGGTGGTGASGGAGSTIAAVRPRQQFGLEPVAGAHHRLDGRLRIVVTDELAAQRSDGDADGVGQRIRVLVPHVLEEPFLAEHLAGVSHEVPKQGELLGREVEEPSSAGGLEARRVELELADAQHRTGPSRIAPQQ